MAFPIPKQARGPAGPDPTAARLEREFKHTSPLIGCRFDPSGRFLFVSAQDNTIQRFDVASTSKVALTGHQSWVRGMAFLPAAGSRPVTLITADYHGKLSWWPADAEKPEAVRTVDAHAGWARAVAVSPDGKTVASCGNDNAVKLWSSEGAPLATLAGHTSHVYNIAFHPSAGRLASADLKGTVKDWDLKAGNSTRDLDAKVLHKYDTTFGADIGGARAMAFNPGGTKLACAGISNVSNAFAGVGNPLIVMFDWATGTAKPYKPKEAFQGTMWGIAFHPAGLVIGGAGGSGGRVWFWKGEDPTSVHMLNVPAGARDLTLSPDGTRYAIAGANGTAYLYTFTPAPSGTGTPPKK